MKLLLPCWGIIFYILSSIHTFIFFLSIIRVEATITKATTTMRTTTITVTTRTTTTTRTNSLVPRITKNLSCLSKSSKSFVTMLVNNNLIPRGGGDGDVGGDGGESVVGGSHDNDDDDDDNNNDENVRTKIIMIPGWIAYNKALDQHPITTKALTSLVGWAVGDLMAQLFLSDTIFHMKRFLIMTFFGFTYSGPLGHYFYQFLDTRIPGTTSPIVAIKIMIDQLIWTPIFLTIFFIYLGVAYGYSWQMIGYKLKNDLLPACHGSWNVWPLVHAVNYKFIATKHRMIFVNTVQVAFNIFLSVIGAIERVE